MSQFKPHYLKVSDKIFKQMLSNSVQDADKIDQCLNSDKKIQFIRQITEVTNNLYYIDLQRQLWQNYFELGMKQGVWAPRLSKSIARQHHICRTYGFPKHIIERRQENIVQYTLDRLKRYIIKLEQDVIQWKPYVDLTFLSTAINECVRSAQQRLRQEFDYKRKMLVLDSDDRQFIRKFYDLQPDEEQIWQTTFDALKAKEQEEILRKRIYLRRLPSTYDRMIYQSLDITKLPRKLVMRAQREPKTVQSIQQLLQQRSHIVIR
ncbi:unnamed protein product [Rotaria sp. Silwood2]|nr:unnamed protein product [Rotaria sp. Silwood2]